MYLKLKLDWDFQVEVIELKLAPRLKIVRGASPYVYIDQSVVLGCEYQLYKRHSILLD